MKITFVQSDGEKAESDRVIRAGLSLRKAKVGTWILPPNLSADGKFTVVDSQPDGRDVFVTSFGTIDGALMYALGVKSDDPRHDPVSGWDRSGALKEWGNFV